MPSVPKSVPRCLFGVKSGSPLERLAIMKSDKVDSAAKMVPMPTPSAAETDSPAGKRKTARMGSCEKSTKPASREAAETCVLLKPDLRFKILSLQFLSFVSLLMQRMKS